MKLLHNDKCNEKRYQNVDVSFQSTDPIEIGGSCRSFCGQRDVVEPCGCFEHATHLRNVVVAGLEMNKGAKERQSDLQKS